MAAIWSLSRSATIALVAVLAGAAANAADRRNVYQSENWTVDELIEDGRFAGCSVRVEYPNGESVTLVLRGTEAISLSFAKSEGYRRGSRWSLQMFADKVRIYEGVAEAGVDGKARAAVPASPTFFRELRDGHNLNVDWQRGAASGRMIYSLKGARGALAAGDLCLVRNLSPTNIVTGSSPARVAGSLYRDGAADRSAIEGLQDALIWAGYYNGLIDGELGLGTLRAIRRFQQDLQAEPTSNLTSAQVDRLLQLAVEERNKTGFKIHNEAETQIQVGLPTKYLTRRERTQHGFAYTSSAGDIKIDTIRLLQHERSLDDLYDQLSKRGAIRKLGYTVKKSSEFVITGEDDEKRYYIRAIQLPDGLRAFAVAHKFDSPVDMGRIMVAMANSLRPGMPAAPAGAAVTPAKPRTEQRFSSGTGVVVTSSGHILTNAHVIEGCTQLAVRQIGDQSRSATIMAIDEKNDLALLRSTVSVPRLPKFRSGARLGETIAVFGFPLAGILAASGNFTLGNITASAGMGNDAGMLQISAPVQAGNSGEPLLDRSGHIVGIIVAKLKNEVAQNANFAIKAAIAQTFLEAHGVQVLTGDSQTALQPEDIAETAKDFTVLIVCQK